MFCSRCGAQLTAGSFCPQCGAPAANQTAQPVGLVPAAPFGSGAPKPDAAVVIRSDPSLPKGLFRGEDGMLRWIVPRKKYTMYFYMNDRIVGMTGVQQRDDTVGQAFKELLLSGLTLAAGSIVRSSQAYNGQELPWESTGTVDNTYLSLSDVRTIRCGPQAGELRLRAILSDITLYTEPAYHRFVLEHITRQAPGARIK